MVGMIEEESQEMWRDMMLTYRKHSISHRKRSFISGTRFDF